MRLYVLFLLLSVAVAQAIATNDVVEISSRKTDSLMASPGLLTTTAPVTPDQNDSSTSAYANQDEDDNLSTTERGRRKKCKKPNRKPNNKPNRKPNRKPQKSRTRGKYHHHPKCRHVKKECGKKCFRNKRKCKTVTSVPKYCIRSKKIASVCPNQSVKMCNHVEKTGYPCKKTVVKKGPCSDKQKKCSYEWTKKLTCTKKGPCDKWRKKRCTYKKKTTTKPCKVPKKPCKMCDGNKVFTKCKKTIKRKVEVPCDQQPETSNSPSSSPSSNPISSLSPSPSHNPYDYPYESPVPSPIGARNAPPKEPPSPSASVEFVDDTTQVPFSDKNKDIYNVRCFTSLFDEAECTNAKVECKLFNDKFDASICAKQVCNDCASLRKSTELSKDFKRFCRSHIRNSCHFFKSLRFATNVDDTNIDTDEEMNQIVSRMNVENDEDVNKIVRSDKKCYKYQTKIIELPCRKTVPKNRMCIKGCLVKRCTKKKKVATEYCQDNLPPLCRKKPRKKCKYQRVKKRVCTESRSKNCEKKQEVASVCYKEKKVSRPCKKQPRNFFSKLFGKKCTKRVNERFVCGKQKKQTYKQCERECKPVYCTKKICN